MERSHPRDIFLKLCKFFILIMLYSMFYQFTNLFILRRFLHSGRAVKRYSDTVYNNGGSYFASFPLEDPPDSFQGYGEVMLKNILPLNSGQGLHPDLDLVIFDALELSENSALEFEVDFTDSFRGSDSIFTCDCLVFWSIM